MLSFSVQYCRNRAAGSSAARMSASSSGVQTRRIAPSVTRRRRSQSMPTGVPETAQQTKPRVWLQADERPAGAAQIRPAERRFSTCGDWNTPVRPQYVKEQRIRRVVQGGCERLRWRSSP